MAENAESLRHLIRMKLGNHPFLVVSNREPYLHVYRHGSVQCIQPASGLTVALDSVMRVSRGTWVAQGSGEADWEVSDSKGFVQVPPNRPAYRLKRIRLTREQEASYYDGFSNSVMWPICHVAFRRPVFSKEYWRGYQEVNAMFADSIAAEIGDERALVFIQDYHLALLSKILRQRCPNAVLAQFWHIPWPNPEVFRICPWKHEILEGLLGNDILGFHIRYHCQNFIDTVDRELEARPDRELNAIVYRGHATKIRAFPISVDFEEISRRAASRETRKRMAALRQRYHLPEDLVLGLGVDRLDYIKGIPERLAALRLLFEEHPQYRGRMTFVQVGVPSRIHLEEYQRLDQEVESSIAAINQDFGSGDWKPIVYTHQDTELSDLIALYRMARFLVVSSLHDGMNLVAKEFVASQGRETGVLLLSRFTGAARELTDALLINPYSPEEIAEGIRAALEMDPAEVRRRMARMRERVRENNIYKWAVSILKKLVKLT